MVEALADAGADLGWQDADSAETALHQAAANGHAVAVRSLAARGGQAAVDARGDYFKQTPLHRAAARGHTATAQALLEAGADASLKDGPGRTALDDAVRKRKHEVAACLQLYAARRLWGARQRLAFARAMLATAATATTAGLGELLPFDVLPPVGEAVASLGPAAARVALRAAEQEQQEQDEAVDGQVGEQEQQDAQEQAHS